MANNLGLYVHIPFCTTKCPYCDFFSVTMEDGLADAYTDGVCRAIEQWPFAPDTVCDTLYFGGGTPSLMGRQRLQKIIHTARRAVPFAADAEISMEANPGGRFEPDQWLEAGVNRISIGIQSLVPQELQALGRTHSVQQAIEAVQLAHSAGLGSVSADLMLAIPYQTEDSLDRSLRTLCQLPVSHISAYLLKVEDTTPFCRSRHLVALPDDDRTASLYLQAVSYFQEQGLAQYEVSNFARPAHQSRHNLKYWTGQDYLGIGPSAHSMVAGRRFYLPSQLQPFIQAENPLSLAVQDGPGGGLEEYVMLSLRLAQGVDTQLVTSRFGADGRRMLEAAAPFVQRELAVVREHTISLTPQGLLLSNPITGALLESVGQR